MTDVFRTAVSVNRNIVKENILQNLRNARFVFRCDNKAWSDTVAADFFLAVLECCILMWTPFSGRRAITKGTYNKGPFKVQFMSIRFFQSHLRRVCREDR